ncbi:hypothetical protein [Humibacillus sp. DSM 29435]|uniref:hypothetical protein n=1 Tax=Humibacillus sp. DSM 29435 TaxID=1869167 RepID=UPI0011132222|nr:hypothetical protein [Humibacillus sp. DSM 29435]
MTSAAELVAQVRMAAEGSPYAVADQPYGFDLTVDVVDATWYTLLRVNHIDRVFTYQVRLDEPKQRMTITDVANTVEWNAGLGSAPTLRAQKSVQKGRVYEFSSHQELGIDAETGDVGKVVDYTFNAGEGRDLIRSAAKQAGWSEAMGREQKIGLYVGLGVIGALVVVGLVVAAVFIIR